MTAAVPRVLTLNAGSSSLRFALIESRDTPIVLMRGRIDRIGLPGTRCIVSSTGADVPQTLPLSASDREATTSWLFDWLAIQPAFEGVSTVSHRVVHGMAHSAPVRVTPELLAELRRFMAFDPEHLPFEIDLITAAQNRYPAATHVACFDTAFHSDMPPVARRLPIPHRYHDLGIQRYGFHGLSYAYLMQELVRVDDPAAKRGRVILAHLGNGASLAAVRDGRSIDTSMGFTPASGMMMGTRSGDLDPGLGHYLSSTQQMDSAQFQKMVNHDSGLLGVSGISADMRDLLAQESSEPRAADAIAMFCYGARKWIGAFAAALGGLDTLVFAGGVGENAAPIRSRICSELGFLGIELDVAANERSAALISRPGSGVRVRVIRTDEELMLARSALHLDTQGKN